MSEIGQTEGTLLAGAVRYAQPLAGYRTGIEPVFLAAAIPAHPGDRVLEAGTGAGAGLLCLTERVAGLSGLGIEIEAEMARLAAANFVANGRQALVVREADLLAAALDAGSFDHVMANPPWHDPAGSPPIDGLKQSAKRATDGLIGTWIAVLARALRHRGTITLVLPPRAMPESLTALTSAGCGSAVVFPLWPRVGREARIMLLQAVKGGRADCRLLPGLLLHEAEGYSAAAEAVLRRGEALPLR